MGKEVERVAVNSKATQGDMDIPSAEEQEKLIEFSNKLPLEDRVAALEEEIQRLKGQK